MELIEKSSSLYFLPVELNRKSQLILDSLRTASEMGEHCYKELHSQLEILDNSEDSKPNRSVIFNYAWSFVDHAYRFVLIYKELSPKSDSIIEKLAYVKKFRDAIQHVNKNLLKSNAKMIENGRPTFGILKWVVGDSEEERAFSNVLISGIFKVDNFTFKQHSQNGYSDTINEIILETNTVGVNHPNEIDLSKLFDDWKSINQQLDDHLKRQIKDENLTLTNWKKLRDIHIKLTNE